MEVWKDIPGYEGFYQASICGKIKGLDYKVQEITGKVRFHKGRVLKTYLVNGGYSVVSLHANGTRKKYLVHRLVALTFIPNPNNYLTVNHIDENKQNNHSYNLEWATLYDNNRHGTHDRRSQLKLSKPVQQFSMIGELIKEFESIAAVKRELGFSSASVNKAANGIYKSSNGYIWKYK